VRMNITISPLDSMLRGLSFAIGRRQSGEIHLTSL
jgi:hypothetical protein